ncbi:hypothetical protein MED121_22597 [Marinomonas sp. MED121]|uniref:hypothetical protein n=1 Tax=Marinomonas sp. MED121 TaxID=314277 RepID=UPI000068FDE0|nr:hypothetical protein [Marinomonas sp. MED121]EAQ65509.1 hypothetical protein MED121_22597 [Marinomonas sp. MED121]
MKKTILMILSMALFSSFILAKDLVEAESTKIIKLSAYSDIGNGDILITVNNPPIGCERGFWVNGNAAGAQHTLSLLLAAKAMNAQVSINGDKDNIWSHTSAGGVCHLFNIDIL